MNYSTTTNQMSRASDMELERVYVRRQIDHPPWLGLPEGKVQKSVKVGSKRSRQSSTFLNPSAISLALIIYFISNQSIVTIMSAGKNLSQNNESARAPLISFAAASPAPEPASARRTSSSSSAHRSPPMNGSIFGKRSVGTIGMVEATRAQEEPSTMKPATNESSLTRKQEKPSADKSATAENVSKSEIISYKDIITEIIEDFLALNNESDPDEASVAFCRMIVYECSQMLTARSKSLSARRKTKRINNTRLTL